MRNKLFRFFYKLDRIKLFLSTKYNLIRYCYIFTKKSSKKVGLRNKIRFNPFKADKLRLTLSDEVYVERNVTFQGTGHIIIGKCSTIGEFTTIGASKMVKIGDYCQIASGCSIRDTDHIIPSNKDEMITTSGIVTEEIIIEDDCWIAANVSITKGVKIGKGSVVAANAVVTKDVPAYSIVAGVPAKIIKKR